MKKVVIYTDGACSGNPGAGGWGAILIYNGVEKLCAGYDKATTNNRMEMFAVIMALRTLKESCDVEIYTDSAYVADAFNKDWITQWQKMKWRTAGKKEVKNQDLWKQLLSEIERHNVKFIKVKGHADNEYNNRCDKMAREQIEMYEKNQPESD